MLSGSLSLRTLFCALEIGLGSVKTCLEPKPKENGDRWRIITRKPIKACPRLLKAGTYSSATQD